MTTDEAEQIESQLGLRIQERWRSLITDDEFCEIHANSGLLTDLKAMMRENRQCRESPYLSPYWQPAWLAIHADGCGNVYFLDTASPLEHVYELDHEKTFPGYQPLDRICFPDIDAFLDHVAEYELETRTEEADKASAKPGFFRRLFGG